jgi:uncharacterized protein YbbC (DUF1343 family)
VDAPAGAPVAHGTHAGIPVLSLYGGERAAVEEALPTVDLVVVDLPDVGCRYYTYAWTVIEALKQAARRDRPVIVLDRPNPLGGRVEGNLPESDTYSAVCASRVPVRHGLTLGELTLWNRLVHGIDGALEIIRCGGWRRDSEWPRLGFPWIPPSPALRDFASVAIYPGTCLVEGTNLSEGRGTERPFTCVGAPFLDGRALAAALTSHPCLDGIAVRPVEFTPRSSKWAGERCGGVALEVTDQYRARPARAGLAVIEAAMRISGFRFEARHFDALAGTSRWREQLEAGVAAVEIAAAWEADELRFAEERRQVELY